jgi:hypothetical protein
VLSVFAKYFWYAMLIVLLDLGARFFLGILKENSVSGFRVYPLKLGKMAAGGVPRCTGRAEIMISNEVDELRRKL